MIQFKFKLSNINLNDPNWFKCWNLTNWVHDGASFSSVRFSASRTVLLAKEDTFDTLSLHLKAMDCHYLLTKVLPFCDNDWPMITVIFKWHLWYLQHHKHCHDQNNLKAETSLAKGCLTTVSTKVGGESADFNSQDILGDNTSGNLWKFEKSWFFVEKFWQHFR